MSSNPSPSDRRNLLPPEESDPFTDSAAIDTPQATSATSATSAASATHLQPALDSSRSDMVSPVSPDLSAMYNSVEHDITAQGLDTPNLAKTASITRRPTGIRAFISPSSPSNPFFATPPEGSPSSSTFTPTSPPWQRYSTSYDGPALKPVNEADEESLERERLSSFREDLFDTLDPRSDSHYSSIPNHHQNLHGPTSMGAASIQYRNADTKLGLTDGCPTAHDIFLKRSNSLSMAILIGSIYSTIFSGIWLVVAILAPPWPMLHSAGGGGLNASAARTVLAFFAKTIEATFVTTFVAFLGQVLSRRSLMKSERGMSISEMSMRSWVIQPGSMVTHWHNLHYAGRSFLGALTLVTAFLSMFYTTASDALVSPHLKYGKLKEKTLFGSVLASYANPIYAAKTCKTPGPPMEDFPADYGTSCLQIQHAGQAYHNGLSYLRTWDGIDAGSGASSNIKQRPLPQAMLYDNTTVTGSWVFTETSDMAKGYAQHKRVINNITLAMPHAGLFSAARHKKNEILQPEQLDGIGKYTITASVVSPTVNVMCVNANKSELAPIIYTEWPNSPPDFIDPANGKSLHWIIDTTVAPGSYLNNTVLDDIFQWGERYKRQPPIFPRYPISHNSIINANMKWPADPYLLIKANDTKTKDFTLCQFRSLHTVSCSTQYNVDGANSGHLQSFCDNPKDDIRYDKSVPDPPTVPQPDWANIAGEWLKALALNNGMFSTNSSSPRMISQFIPVEPKLSPSVPSIAEYLAVLAGHTLLMGTTDSTFRHYWGYQDTILEAPGELEAFNGTIISQQYGSGYSARWERMFYIVLSLVFVISSCCLVYFIVQPGLVTDFTEQENLFALAINSPPTARLSGSCGAGPEGKQMSISFRVIQDEGSRHYYLADSGHNIVDSEMGMMRRQYRRAFRHQ